MNKNYHMQRYILGNEDYLVQVSGVGVYVLCLQVCVRVLVIVGS